MPSRLPGNVVLSNAVKEDGWDDHIQNNPADPTLSKN